VFEHSIPPYELAIHGQRRFPGVDNLGLSDGFIQIGIKQGTTEFALEPTGICCWPSHHVRITILQGKTIVWINTISKIRWRQAI
jgi:hypothetical protein